MARALSGALSPDRLTVVVNVGDDDYMYGAYVAADLDTVTYTLAGVEGPQGWGIRDDSFSVMDALADRGVDTAFRLGDRDLATCLLRTDALLQQQPLSAITAQITESLGVQQRVLPASDEQIQTRVKITDNSWLSFQEYFVARGHRDEVIALAYEGIESAKPAPGVVEAVAGADLVVIAPSNPPLSIWPILQIPGVAAAIAAADNVVAVSPLFAGKALKGPADRVLASLGLAPGTAGILQAYEGLLTTLIVDESDADDVRLSTAQTTVVAADTKITDPEAGRHFGQWVIDTMVP